MSVAQPILSIGDKVGARMAFIEAYTKLIEAAKSEGKPATYQVSLGYSPERRQTAIAEAVKKGLLEAPKVEHLLPAPHGFEEPEPEVSPEEKSRRNEAIQSLRSLLDSFDDAKKEQEAERRRQEEERREELLKQVDEQARGAA